MRRETLEIGAAFLFWWGGWWILVVYAGYSIYNCIDLLFSFLFLFFVLYLSFFVSILLFLFLKSVLLKPGPGNSQGGLLPTIWGEVKCLLAFNWLWILSFWPAYLALCHQKANTLSVGFQMSFPPLVWLMVKRCLCIWNWKLSFSRWSLCLIHWKSFPYLWEDQDLPLVGSYLYWGEKLLTLFPFNSAPPIQLLVLLFCHYWLSLIKSSHDFEPGAVDLSVLLPLQDRPFLRSLPFC